MESTQLFTVAGTSEARSEGNFLPSVNLPALAGVVDVNAHKQMHKAKKFLIKTNFQEVKIILN